MMFRMKLRSKSMVDSIVGEFGRLDMAVNNAGISNETGTVGAVE